MKGTNERAAQVIESYINVFTRRFILPPPPPPHTKNACREQIQYLKDSRITCLRRCNNKDKLK